MTLKDEPGITGKRKYIHCIDLMAPRTLCTRYKQSFGLLVPRAGVLGDLDRRPGGLGCIVKSHVIVVARRVHFVGLHFLRSLSGRPQAAVKQPLMIVSDALTVTNKTQIC